MDDSEASWLEKVWWAIFGSVIYVLLGPGMILNWIVQPKGHRPGSGDLGMAAILSIAFWAIVVACGVGFLLPW